MGDGDPGRRKEERIEAVPTAGTPLALPVFYQLVSSEGRPLDIDDRIGGTLQILGQPGFPVILTALADDAVGAGFTPNGLPQVDTRSDGSAPFPVPGDWRSVRLDQFSNDRNAAS